MPTELILFYILATALIGTAVCVVLPPMGNNPIHSAVALIVSFFFLAGMYALLAAHLLAALQIIVYAGAIMVLFTFVIMLLNLSPDEIKPTEVAPVKVIGAMVALFVFGKLLTAIGFAAAGARAVDLSVPRHAAYGSIEDIAQMLYTTFMVPFELISVLLLVAVVGAVMLAKKRLGPGGGQGEAALADGANDHVEESP